MPRCLGRAPSPPNVRTLRLANYLNVVQLPQPPTKIDWGTSVNGKWTMMLNNQIGDCTVAAVGHLIQQWTANDAPAMVTIPDSEILKAYSAVSGYVPGLPATDRGANMMDVLRYWSKTGIGGHSGIGYVGVDPTNLDQVKAALWLFGGVYGGCQIFQSWLEYDWTATSGRYAGGHAWELCDWDGSTFGVVTWGEVRRFSPAAWKATMGAQRDAELYAILAPEWTGADSMTPSGMNWKQLDNDLAIIAGRPLPWPDLDPTPVPPPTPVPVPPQPVPISTATVTVSVGGTVYSGTVPRI